MASSFEFSWMVRSSLFSVYI
ncbi:hypothetical protein M8C21_011922 [Ambrosia artemisiifolia]|uniref:Uncharacterized protein n=1 Tax=Ambrosia artemisiifolia TaxID=4212 RepID=A0AAD5BQC0_AMBAR|nr:hypothetical protein M8C21_011922 [Ambrosia artemisiifolia]